MEECRSGTWRVNDEKEELTHFTGRACWIESIPGRTASPLMLETHGHIKNSPFGQDNKVEFPPQFADPHRNRVSPLIQCFHTKTALSHPNWAISASSLHQQISLSFNSFHVGTVSDRKATLNNSPITKLRNIYILSWHEKLWTTWYVLFCE